MQAILVFALVGFAASAVFHGLRVRRASFMAGLALEPTEADRQVGGWLSSLLLRSPALCRAAEALSQILPGQSAGDEVVEGTTTFTYLQSRTTLHRYFRWQVHNMLRLIVALLFCGIVLFCASWGYSTRGQTMVAAGSALLCCWALASWWRIRTDCEGARRFSKAGPDSDDHPVVGAFVELSRGALRQGVAFALVFVCNMAFQVIVLTDSESMLSLNESLERIHRIEENLREDPTAFAG